jgi:hypothetical protein
LIGTYKEAGSRAQRNCGVLRKVLTSHISDEGVKPGTLASTLTQDRRGQSIRSLAGTEGVGQGAAPKVCRQRDIVEV